MRRIWVLPVACAGLLITACGPSTATSNATPTASSQATTLPSPSKTCGVPPARGNAGIAYDPALHELVLVAGTGGVYGPGLTDAWQWDGQCWSPLSQAALTGPNAVRITGGLAYDESVRRIFMVADGEPGFETLAWDGTVWHTLHPAQQPAGPIGPIAYDTALSKIVMLGGASGTWTWDGNDWSHLVTRHQPSSFLCCLTYDAARRQLLYLGSLGYDSHGQSTWIFDGTDWRQADAPTPAGNQLLLVYDSKLATTLILGGDQNTPSSMGMWSWSGSAWKPLGPLPFSVDTGTVGAYDANSSQVVVFGGVTRSGMATNQTWTWDGQSWIKRL